MKLNFWVLFTIFFAKFLESIFLIFLCCGEICGICRSRKFRFCFGRLSGSATDQNLPKFLRVSFAFRFCLSIVNFRWFFGKFFGCRFLRFFCFWVFVKFFVGESEIKIFVILILVENFLEFEFLFFLLKFQFFNFPICFWKFLQFFKIFICRKLKKFFINFHSIFWLNFFL